MRPEDRSMRLASSTLPQKVTCNSCVAGHHRSLLFRLQKLIHDEVLSKTGNIPQDEIVVILPQAYKQCLQIDLLPSKKYFFSNRKSTG
jgi:hypothetical protein